MKKISPSLICMDLCNIEAEVLRLEMLGISMLHIDIIDGIYSPDMPLGVDIIRQLREKSNMEFDAHLMSVNNEAYAELLLESGINRLCFHTEFEKRPSILIRKIKSRGVKAGIAISPETPISILEHLIPMCDFVLLMRIDAGYAHLAGQGIYDCVDGKIAKIREISKDIEIEVDGRIGFDEIASLGRQGVDTFVCGTKSLFLKPCNIEENYERIKKIFVSEGF